MAGTAHVASHEASPGHFLSDYSNSNTGLLVVQRFSLKLGHLPVVGGPLQESLLQASVWFITAEKGEVASASQCRGFLFFIYSLQLKRGGVAKAKCEGEKEKECRGSYYRVQEPTAARAAPRTYLN